MNGRTSGFRRDGLIRFIFDEITLYILAAMHPVVARFTQQYQIAHLGSQVDHREGDDVVDVEGDLPSLLSPTSLTYQITLSHLWSYRFPILTGIKRLAFRGDGDG